MSANSVVHEFILKDMVSSPLEKIVKNSEAATDKVVKNLDGIDKKAHANAGSIGNLGSSFKKFAGIAAGAFAAIGVAGFVSDSIHAAEHVQSMQKSFEALTKSKDKASQLVGLRQELAKLPIPIQDADLAMKKLLASGITSRGEMGKVATQLAAVSSATHQNLGEVAQVYEKIRNNGKLTGETLQQLMDKGIGAPLVKEIAKSMKISEHSVHEMVSKGKVSFDIFQKALDATTTGTGIFSTVLADMATTVEGRAAIVANKAQLIRESFGAAFLPAKSAFLDLQSSVLDKMIPLLDGIAKAVTWVTQNFETILMVVAPLAAAWTGYTIAVQAHTIATKISALATALMTGGIRGLNIAMKANPVGLVVAGIMALATVITMAWQKSEKFRGIVLGVWEVMKSFASALGNMFKSPWETIKSIFNGITEYVKRLIAPLMETIDHVKNGRWLDAAKSSGKFLLNLTPVGQVMTAVDMVKESGVLDSVASSFAEGYAKGKSKEEKKEDEKKDGITTDNTNGGHSPIDLTKPDGGSSTGTAKNIVLNISNLIGEFTVNSNGIKQSYEEIKTMVTQAIVDGVRDSELSFG